MNTVYSPESRLRSPRKLLHSMWMDMLASRELAWQLTIRDISARYRQSVLGILWAFFPPIVTTIIFVLLNKKGAINIGETNIPYPAFVMLGTVLWWLFVESLNAPLKIVMKNKLMLAKVNFPREAFILSAIAQVLFDFSIRFLIVIAVFILFHIPLTWGILLSLFAIIILMLLGIMIGMFFVPFGVLYTDVSSAIATVTSLWFFVTPVVYPTPTRFPYSILININPVSPLLSGARELATQGTISSTLPFFIISGLTILGLLVMWVVYRLSLPIIIERIGA